MKRNGGGSIITPSTLVPTGDVVMRRNWFLLMCTAFAVGCGSKTPGLPGSGDGPRAELPAAEAKDLAELEKQIAAKKKELADLEARANAIRAKAGGGDLGELQKLLDGMPKESEPKADERATIERNKAQMWMKENVVGKKIAFRTKVELSDVKPFNLSREQNQYTAESFSVGKRLYDENNHRQGLVGDVGNVRSGDGEWRVAVFTNYGTPGKLVMTEESAKRFRELAGKTARIEATVATAEFKRFPIYDPKKQAVVEEKPELHVYLDIVTIDGVDYQRK